MTTLIARYILLSSARSRDATVRCRVDFARFRQLISSLGPRAGDQADGAADQSAHRGVTHRATDDRASAGDQTGAD
jgi:hypothetical protein